jgi:hypothetical protein
MLAYFPEVYPNELLYSVLGRLRCHLGTESSMSFLLDVFGHHNVRAGAYLQTNLGRLAANLPASRGLTAERLAMETTLLPYFCAFQPPDVRVRMVAELIGDSRDAYLMPYQFNQIKGAARPPVALRYCPTCCEEMLQKHGELYWRRDHQLPGVLVCPEHGRPLAESQLDLAQTKRHAFIAADLQNCSANPAPSTWSNHVGVVNLLHEIAISSAALLKSPIPDRSSDMLKDEIVVTLRSRGFGSGKRSINLPLLRAAFMTRFGPVSDILPDAVPGDWLKKIALKYEKPLAPIRYVFIDLLIASMPLEDVSNPFGVGPWPCQNPLADHCGQMMIRDCKLSEEKGEVSGIFRCPCGYAFSRSSALVSRVNVLDFGPLFETRLRELVLTGSVPKGIAKALHVPHMTILNQVAKLGLKTSWNVPVERIKRPRVDRDAMRTAWTDGHNANPSLTRRELHKKHSTVYGWLRWNDRKWLDDQPPSQIRRSSQGRGKDWSSFDAAKVQSLKKEAAGVRVLDPPKRVSHTALLNVIGRYDWRRTHLFKLPQSISTITELAESTDDFRCRRIVWAAEQLKRLDLTFTVTHLRRVAGLPGKCTRDVEEFLRCTADGL